jgi:hypothetical protein
MNMLLRQIFVAMLGGVVAASVMLVANNFQRMPNIALAQMNTSISDTDSINADARNTINYQGQVYDPNSGAPYVNTGFNFSFRLYNNSAGISQVYREDKFILTNVDGFFNTNIGDLANFGDVNNIFNGQELYLRVYINDQELGPLQPITFVPYAFWAERADHLDGYDSDDFPKLVAFGVVNGEGGRDSGEHFSSSLGFVDGAQLYIINLDGVNHSIFNYTTIVTPACDRPVVTGVGTSEGDLLVDVWDTNGFRTKCRFEFMVLEKE